MITYVIENFESKLIFARFSLNRTTNCRCATMKKIIVKILCVNFTMIFFRTNFGGYGGEDDDTSSSATGGRFRSRFLRGEDEDESGTGNR